MPDQWYMVYRTADGEAVSSGTAVADPLPAGLATVAIDGPIDPAVEWWDPATRAVVPRAATPPSLEAALADLAQAQADLAIAAGHGGGRSHVLYRRLREARAALRTAT